MPLHLILITAIVCAGSVFAQGVESDETQVVTCPAHWKSLATSSRSIRCIDLPGGSFAEIVRFAELSQLEIIKCDALTESDCDAIERLSVLSSLSIHRIRSTPTRLFAAIAKLRHLTSLSVTACGGELGACLALLRGHPSVSVVCLSKSECGTGGDILALSSIPSLRRLCLDGCEHVADNGLAYLAECTQLEELSLKGCLITAKNTAAILARVSKLRALALPASNEFSDAALAGIAASPLEELDIADNPVATGVGLGRFGKLLKLVVSGCTRIAEAGWKEIASLERLRHLNASRCLLTNDYCRFLTDLGELTQLDVSACTLISESGFAQFGGMHLESIHLAGCKGVSSQGLRRAINDKYLRSIVLDACGGVNDESILLLGDCKKLELLSLSRCSGLTEKAAEGIAKMALVRLDLHGCAFVDDAFLEKLGFSLTLAFVDLRECLAVTPEGCARFKKARPSVRIAR